MSDEHFQKRLPRAIPVPGGVEAAPREKPAAKGPASGLLGTNLDGALGMILFYGGVICAFLFWMMDTTLPAADGSGERVANLLQMQRQLLGVLASVAAACTGLLLRGLSLLGRK